MNQFHYIIFGCNVSPSLLITAPMVPYSTVPDKVFRFDSIYAGPNVIGWDNVRFHQAEIVRPSGLSAVHNSVLSPILSFPQPN